MRRSHFFVESSFFHQSAFGPLQRSCSVGAEKANCFGLVIRERYHRLDTLFDAKTIPIAVGFELRSELRNRPLCIRFHDLALRTYSSCCVPPNLCLLNCPRNSIAPGGHKPRGRQWEQFLPIQKRLRAALACRARRWGMRSGPGWKIPPSSRSCSIRTAGCGSTAWPEALATPGSDCRWKTASASFVSSPTRSAPRSFPGRRAFSAELPTGERFEGLLPPIVKAATFAIRKPAVAIFTLGDYARAGIMTAWAGPFSCPS